MKISMLPADDATCGWINTLPARREPNRLRGDVSADWAIVGAGFTGLAAARRLTELAPDARVVMVDAQRAGESASGRNSGFIVDVSTSRAGTREEEDEIYLAKHRLNLAAISALEGLVREHGIDCQWRQIGKYHCAADEANVGEVEAIATFCRRLGLEHLTPHAVMVQPGALVRGLFESLPDSVTILEESPVTAIEYGSTIRLHCAGGVVNARNLIFAANGFLPSLGVQRRRLMPLTLTASLTRPLTVPERQAIGEPSDWGVLAAHGMGATVRYTEDHRIMMRNTVEYWPRLSMTAAELEKRRVIHRDAIGARFPALEKLAIEYTWSGLVCVSSNLMPSFGRLSDNVYVSGGYNGSGVGGGTIRGALIVDYAFHRDSDLLQDVLGCPRPGWIPPRPFLDLGAVWRLRRARVGRGRDL